MIDDTVRSLAAAAAAAARALPPSRSPSPQCPRPLRSADLPGASYFAPQGRHISHEACRSSRIVYYIFMAVHAVIAYVFGARVQTGKLAGGRPVISRPAPAMTTHAVHRVLEYRLRAVS